MSCKLLSSLLILVVLGVSSGCNSQSSQSIPLEERTHSELKQDITTTDQKEPVPTTKPSESPIQPMTYWAIPFLSAKEANQLYQMLDNDTKALAKQLFSVHALKSVHVINQTLTLKECQEYFEENGLFEHAEKIVFQRSDIDVECFEKLPNTLTDLTFYKSQLVNHKSEFSEQLWVKVLESIAVHAPHLQNLNINLHRSNDRSWYFNEKATAVIANRMISLRHLTIEAFIKGKAVREIAQRNLIQLTHLNLGGNRIEDEEINAIAQGNLPNLNYLDLSFNKIGLRGATYIAHGRLERLTHLDLFWNKIGAIGAEAIFRGNLPNLTHLDVGFNQLGNVGAIAVARTNFMNLTHLDIGVNNIDAEGAIAIARGNLGSITHLDISFNEINAEGIQAIREHLLPRLTYLNLIQNRLEEHGAVAQEKLYKKISRNLWN